MLADRYTMRKFRVGNGSSAKIRVDWRTLSRDTLSMLEAVSGLAVGSRVEVKDTLDAEVDGRHVEIRSIAGKFPDAKFTAACVLAERELRIGGGAARLARHTGVGAGSRARFRIADVDLNKQTVSLVAGSTPDRVVIRDEGGGEDRVIANASAVFTEAAAGKGKRDPSKMTVSIPRGEHEGRSVRVVAEDAEGLRRRVMSYFAAHRRNFIP